MILTPEEMEVLLPILVLQEQDHRIAAKERINNADEQAWRRADIINGIRRKIAETDPIEDKIAAVNKDRASATERLTQIQAEVKQLTAFLHKCDGALEVLNQLKTSTPSNGAEPNGQSQQSSDGCCETQAA